jgi:hypothetical protein
LKEIFPFYFVFVFGEERKISNSKFWTKSLDKKIENIGPTIRQSF